MLEGKADRFLSKVYPEPNTGCWLWIGAQQGEGQGAGYGDFYFQGVRTRAHRASYELFVGEIPNGLFVLHKCDVRCCVNPEHLFLGTHRSNMDDMVQKGHVQRPYGNRYAVGRRR